MTYVEQRNSGILNVTGSIIDQITVFLIDLILPDALWPLTKMSTRNLSGGKGRPERKADLIVISERIVYKMWEPRRLTTLGASTDCYGDNLSHRTIKLMRGKNIDNIVSVLNLSLHLTLIVMQPVMPEMCQETCVQLPEVSTISSAFV
jgi:hypothetical protein